MSRNGIAGDGPAIEAHGLVKVYDESLALDGIDLTVRRGQVFGFLGPNGAGKTTTIASWLPWPGRTAAPPASSVTTW
jgi:ABC-2 type transport system ATP-binding protein